LVVEDHRPLAENVAALFRDEGCEVAIADGAQAACEAIGEAGCDLALIDIRLPDASGVDLAGVIKERCNEAEVILITGAATLDTALAAIRGAAYAYLPKPFDPNELRALGRRALSQVALRRERSRLQRELSQSESLYRGVVDAVDSFIVGLGPGGTIEIWNRATADSTGFPSDQILGQPLGRYLFSQRSRDQLDEALARAMLGGTVVGLELPLRTRDGGQRIVRWTLSRLAGPEQGGPLVLAAGIDLTDRIDLERRAAEAEAMASLGSLTAGLAHEIRNPLNGAVLQLELLQRSAARLDDGEIAQRIGSRVAIVREELNRLNRLLEDFLNLAKPRAIEKSNVDLRALIAEVAELQAEPARRLGIAIGLRIEDGELVVHGHAPMLRQVLVNLVVNAIEAMRERGHGRIELGCHQKSDTRLELSVEDDGPGIPEEIAGRLFAPFVTSKEAGTGLGLTIVKRIIDRHGGTIHIGSEPGRGTKVHVSLQRAM
jgi:PAS domain S-box-containing protein